MYLFSSIKNANFDSRSASRGHEMLPLSTPFNVQLVKHPRLSKGSSAHYTGTLERLSHLPVWRYRGGGACDPRPHWSHDSWAHSPENHSTWEVGHRTPGSQHRGAHSHRMGPTTPGLPATVALMTPATLSDNPRPGGDACHPGPSLLPLTMPGQQCPDPGHLGCRGGVLQPGALPWQCQWQREPGLQRRKEQEQGQWGHLCHRPWTGGKFWVPNAAGGRSGKRNQKLELQHHLLKNQKRASNHQSVELLESKLKNVLPK